MKEDRNERKNACTQTDIEKREGKREKERERECLKAQIQILNRRN